MKKISSYSIYYCLIMIAGLSLPVVAGAQEFQMKAARKEVAEGNKYYQQQDWTNAKKHYANALLKEKDNAAAQYNMGNTLYKSNEAETARAAYEQSIANTHNRYTKARAYHNIGNTYAQEEKWKEAAAAYKNALKHHPGDEESRYNLAYAHKKLKQQQEQEEQNKQEPPQQPPSKDQQQNQDNRQQDQKQEHAPQPTDPNKEKQDQKGEDRQDQEEKARQHQKPQPSRLSEQQAENILNALRQEEKRIQEEKNQKGKERVRFRNQRKDW